MEELKRSFPAVVDARTRLLLLGSLPGEESLARRQYYANPRNHFWRLMEAVLGTALLTLPYEARLEALLAGNVGLWDTVGAATRRGSLDGKIKGESANDLHSLVAALPNLRAVAFNGGKAAAVGMPQLAKKDRLALVLLPSSSPAYTLPFEEKLALWIKLKDYL